MGQNTNGPQFMSHEREVKRARQEMKDVLADLRERGFSEEEIAKQREYVLDPLNIFGDIK